MNNNTKKTWSPNLELQDVMEVSKSFFNKCESKKILTSNSYRLFQVYKTENNWPLDNLIEVSRFFKFSKNEPRQVREISELKRKKILLVLKSTYLKKKKTQPQTEPKTPSKSSKKIKGTRS